MLWYATHQLLLVIPTLLGVAIAVFFLIRVMPGDVVVVKLRADGAAVPEETIQARSKRLASRKASLRAVHRLPGRFAASRSRQIAGDRRACHEGDRAQDAG